jgi:hypothetical protein
MKSKLRLFHRHFFALRFSNTIQNLPCSGELLLNVPMRTTVRRRTEEGTLQRCHSSIDSTFAPTRDTTDGVLGGAAEGFAVGSRGNWQMGK